MSTQFLQPGLSYGISEAYQNLYEATQILQNPEQKKEKIRQALDRFLSPETTAKFSIEAENPALKETWQNYKKLVQGLSGENLQKETVEKINKLFKENKGMETEQDLLAACEKYGVEISTYKDVIEYAQRRIKGDTGLGVSPLFKALFRNDYDLFKMLNEFNPKILRYSINIPCEFFSGYTLFMLTAFGGNVEMLKLLYDFGGNINQSEISNSIKKTPMSLAIENSKYETVELLHRYGVPLDETLLLIAQRKGDRTMISTFHNLDPQINEKMKMRIEVCKKYGVQLPSYNDFLYQCAFLSREGLEIENFITTIKSNLNLIRVLKELRPDILANFINQPDVDGMTPLMVAAKDENFPMITCLHECGADLNQPNEEGDTPMIIAAAEGAKDVVTLLHQYGAYLETPNELGMTPMFKAAETNNIDMMEHLYELARVTGATINLNRTILVESTKRLFKQIPFLIAIQSKSTIKAVELLKKWGGLDQEYCLEYTRRKIIAHLWGINGRSMLTDTKGENSVHMSLEGFSKSKSKRILLRHVNNFFKNKQINQNIKGEIQNSIANAIVAGDAQTPSNESALIVQKIRSGEPIVILGGYNQRNSRGGHAISIVIKGNQLGICDKTGEDSGMQFYSLPTVNEEMIEKLRSVGNGRKNFYDMIESLGLEPTWRVDQKKQKVGNCTWVSAKGAFEMLCILCTDERTGRKIYKEFTTYVREEGLQEYLNQSTNPDFEILRRIQEKYNQKPAVLLSEGLLRQLDQRLEEHARKS